MHAIVGFSAETLQSGEGGMAHSSSEKKKKKPANQEYITQQSCPTGIKVRYIRKGWNEFSWNEKIQIGNIKITIAIIIC